MEAEGIDCTRVAYDQPSQHSAVVVAREDATRTISWLPQPKADARMRARLPGFLEGVDVVRLDFTDRRLAVAALDESERRGITTVIDTGSGRPWTSSLLDRVHHMLAPEKYVLNATGHRAEEAVVERRVLRPRCMVRGAEGHPARQHRHPDVGPAGGRALAGSCRRVLVTPEAGD